MTTNAGSSGQALGSQGVYARVLVDAGLTLGVCDWGFCVYRDEYSACRGDAFGPNLERREPSTCARCKNFVVSSEHRSYWLDQLPPGDPCPHPLRRRVLVVPRDRGSEIPAMYDCSICDRGPNHLPSAGSKHVMGWRVIPWRTSQIYGLLRESGVSVPVSWLSSRQYMQTRCLLGARAMHHRYAR
jgi:hypothetical protein